MVKVAILEEMDVSGTITHTRDEARRTGKTQEATIEVGGRICTIKATPGRWLFQGTNIKIEHKTLDGRTCTASFTYDEGRGITEGIKTLAKGIKNIEAEFTAAIKIPEVSKKYTKKQALQTIFRGMGSFTQPMSISSIYYNGPRILSFLGDVEKFVRENDLTRTEIAELKQNLRKLCGDTTIQWRNGQFSINECDGNPHCRNIALQAESLEILLDAKAHGQVKLERNVPPAVKKLGNGSYNTVSLAHTQKGGKGPIALKPCDQSKSKNDQTGFAKGASMVQRFIGTASGGYRRNKATARVQDMLCEVGTRMTVKVPRVIATVSAAEINGVPSIAMEMLEGKTVGVCAREREQLNTTTSSYAGKPGCNFRTY
ncbi:MAG: hypothetical protein LBC11_02435 [Puniceicoccales bacterium]|jgi:hypothetical protein|nr:hypothetical protein [Puniceicoccales bacterium]